MPPKADIKLGQLLIQKQLCTLKQVSEALSCQEMMLARGQRKTLGSILLENKIISQAELMRVLALMGSLVLSCHDCHQEYSISEYDPEIEYSCHNCGGKLNLSSGQPQDSEELIPYHSTTSASTDVTAFDPAFQGRSVNGDALPPKDPYIGKVFGGCKLIEKIAAGGMGVVYKAQQLNLNRLVAVKVLSRELSNDKTFVRRFIEEARSAAQLNHGNIVHINDVGDFQGIFFFTMEYVDGVNLKTLLQEKKRLSVERTMEVALQVCQALRHAHHRKIIHRDIKPENIMITRDGVVKLADLGLAKRINPKGGDNLTQAGSIMGTPFYMAPEQAKDFSKVDERSDIYSLGVTLFKTITGQVPFRGRTPIEVMIRVIDGRRPALSDLCSKVSPKVERIIDRMMQRQPVDRYQTVGELILDLEQALEYLTDEVT